MVIFTARQNLANLNEVKMNLIVKFANLAGKSYNTISSRLTIFFLNITQEIFSSNLFIQK